MVNRPDDFVRAGGGGGGLGRIGFRSNVEVGPTGFVYPAASFGIIPG